MNYMDESLEVELWDYFHSLGERKRDLNSDSSHGGKANRLDVRDVEEVNSRGPGRMLVPHWRVWKEEAIRGKGLSWALDMGNFQKGTEYIYLEGRSGVIFRDLGVISMHVVIEAVKR